MSLYLSWFFIVFILLFTYLLKTMKYNKHFESFIAQTTFSSHPQLWSLYIAYPHLIISLPEYEQIIGNL